MLTPTPVPPQKARFTSNNAIIKDHHYYQGNDFTWNKPCAISDKFYPYYHKQNNEYKETIEKLQEQEKQDKANLEQLRRDTIISMKQQTKARFDQKLKERFLIQNKSHQPIRSLPHLDQTDYNEEEALDVIAKNIDAAKHTRSNDISWNHLHRASKKYVEQYLRPISIQREEETMQCFKKKIEKEQMVEEEKLSKRSANHQAIRQIFLNKHEENYNRETRLGLAPAMSCNSLSHRPYSTISKDNYPSIQIIGDEPCEKDTQNILPSMAPSLSTIDGQFKVKFPSSLPNLDETRNRTINTMSLNKLAEPRKATNKEYGLEYSELKGMLIKNMDAKVYHPGNNFYDALVTENKFFQDTLRGNRDERKKMANFRITRPTTSSHLNASVNPSTSYTQSQALTGKASQRSIKTSRNEKTIKPLSERDECINELDLFEKRAPLAKPVGYAQSDLLEFRRSSGIQKLQC